MPASEGSEKIAISLEFKFQKNLKKYDGHLQDKLGDKRDQYYRVLLDSPTNISSVLVLWKLRWLLCFVMWRVVTQVGPLILWGLV